MDKPSKPKFYYSINIFVYLTGIALSLLYKLWINKYWPDSIFSSGTTFVVPYIALTSVFLFRGYKKEKRIYEEHIEEVARISKEKIYNDNERESLKHSTVNENIKNYIKEQEKKRACKKPWQFWL